MNNSQAGGIVTFVVIGLVLAGLLGGGLYASKQMGRADRTNDSSTPQVAQNEDNTQSEDEEAAAGRDSDETAPATTTPKPETKPAPTTPAPTTPTNRVATTGPSDTLPATGPAETGAAVFVLGGLTFAFYRHAQSRRELRRNALRS